LRRLADDLERKSNRGFEAGSGFDEHRARSGPLFLLRTRQAASTGLNQWEQISEHRHLFPMPRYFFHVYHEQPEIDEEGEELPDKHAAWREATLMAGQSLQGLDGKLQPGREWRMEVTDEFANALYVLHIHAEKAK
jgi:hypothetical protein